MSRTSVPAIPRRCHTEDGRTFREAVPGQRQTITSNESAGSPPWRPGSVSIGIKVDRLVARARPAVRDEQRKRVGPATAFVDDMRANT